MLTWVVSFQQQLALLRFCIIVFCISLIVFEPYAFQQSTLRKPLRKFYTMLLVTIDECVRFQLPSLAVTWISSFLFDRFNVSPVGHLFRAECLKGVCCRCFVLSTLTFLLSCLLFFLLFSQTLHVLSIMIISLFCTLYAILQMIFVKFSSHCFSSGFFNKSLLCYFFGCKFYV